MSVTVNSSGPHAHRLPAVEFKVSEREEAASRQCANTGEMKVNQQLGGTMIPAHVAPIGRGRALGRERMKADKVSGQLADVSGRTPPLYRGVSAPRTGVRQAVNSRGVVFSKSQLRSWRRGRVSWNFTVGCLCPALGASPNQQGSPVLPAPRPRTGRQHKPERSPTPQGTRFYRGESHSKWSRK